MMLSKMDINEGISKSIEELHVTAAKGKRTKRLRPWSPCAVAGTAAVTSSSSSGAADSSSTIEGADQEEEDMANCLILLAQGRGEERVIIPHHNKQKEGEIENHVGDDNKSMMMTEKTTKIGFYVYECKTCNRTFPSFQALGGHRASHKKPKATVTQEEKKSPPPPPPPPAPPLITSTSTRDFEETRQTHVPHRVSLELGVNLHSNKSTNSKSKIHECSICGAEFTSGQALGGHMRRHRAVQAAATVAASTGNNSAAVQIKPRIVLELDLNLPAPEDDLRDSAFQIPATATQKSMVLSAAPALVGCHY